MTAPNLHVLMVTNLW